MTKQVKHTLFLLLANHKSPYGIVKLQFFLIRLNFQED